MTIASWLKCDCVVLVTMVNIFSVQPLCQGVWMDITAENKKQGSGDVFVAARAASLKDVPVQERRREAGKPLYLTRYE